MTTANRSTTSDAPPSAAVPTFDLHAPARAIVFTRIIDAPRDLVFAAWTDAKHLAHWWGPKGFTNPVCEADARPGGAILIHMCGPDGSEFPMRGLFNELVAPERLVITTTAFEDENGNPQLEAVNTITFTDLDGKTRLTVEAVITKAAPEFATATSGMEEGWNESLDRLSAHVEQNDDGQQNTGSSTVNNTLINKTQVTAEPRQKSIVITRTFEAPRRLVFEAWTKPEHIVNWWGCPQSTALVCEIDLRPGGAWRFVSRDSKGNEYPFKGEYREVVAPERLVHTQIYDVEPYSVHEALVTVIFDEQDGKTTITETILHASEEARDGHYQSGLAEGVGSSFSRLDDLLATL